MHGARTVHARCTCDDLGVGEEGKLDARGAHPLKVRGEVSCGVHQPEEPRSLDLDGRSQ